eukprot:TRINITY_DN40010_c0_g1_i1.p1 TRINITY_DN40010_c0_g1~~TRINITY_DN40010_c0_g1_i1.p1  ORF type:complete len:248 (-),score=45.39 TRINITY_DN40010_c0_g1_i1:252-995(-)
MALEVGLALYLERENEGPLAGDIELEVKDDEGAQTLKAHALVLSLRSPVWAAEFREGCLRESRERRVRIQVVKIAHFKMFLQLLYTNKIDAPADVSAQDVMEVTALADRYGVAGFATQLSEALSRKLKWGTNVASVFAWLKRLPHGSEYRDGHVAAILQKIVSPGRYKEDFEKECSLLGDEVSVEVLQTKMLFIQTVRSKVMNSWNTAYNSQDTKNAIEIIDLYLWKALTEHGLTSDEPVAKRQRID